MKTKSKGVFAQCQDGTWKIDTKVKVDGAFRHFKRVGYLTLSSAKADYERAKQEFIKSKEQHCKVATFDDLLREYVKMRQIIVDILTLKNDESVYNAYLQPSFGGKLLQNVFDKDNFQKWYQDLVSDSRYSNGIKSKVISRIKDILKFAYTHKYIDAIMFQDCDVCLYQIKNAKKSKVERVAWTIAEQNAFFSVIDKQSADYVMFRLFFLTSPRLGEFLALMPKSFNRNTKKITINQQVREITGQGQVLTEHLKTHDSYRTIMIDESTSDLLCEYIDNLNIKDNEFLFGEKHNTPMARCTFRSKLNYYIALSGIRKNVPHGIRHTAATMLASACENAQDIEAAAKRLGHSPQVFLNTYGLHNTDDSESELLTKMNKHLA